MRNFTLTPKFKMAPNLNSKTNMEYLLNRKIIWLLFLSCIFSIISNIGNIFFDIFHVLFHIDLSDHFLVNFGFITSVMGVFFGAFGAGYCVVYHQYGKLFFSLIALSLSLYTSFLHIISFIFSYGTN